MLWRCKGVILISLAAAVSVATQLGMVEECVHGTVAMCTSVGTGNSTRRNGGGVSARLNSNVCISGNMVTQGVGMVEEWVHGTVAM